MMNSVLTLSLSGLKRCKRPLLALAQGLLLLSLCATAAAQTVSCDSPIQTYKLDYKAEISGISVESTRSLEQLEGNMYRVGGEASLWFMSIEEYSNFELVDGKIRPLSYLYDRSGMGDSKDYHLAFLWDSMVAENRMHESWQLPLKPDMQDMLSHQEQLRLDLRCADEERLKQSFVYRIAKKERIREYRYQVLGEELLSTPMGQLRALKLEKLEDDSDRQTLAWLALDWDYIILQLEYREGDDDSNSLRLLNGSVAGQTIRGINS